MRALEVHQPGIVLFRRGSDRSFRRVVLGVLAVSGLLLAV
jgi:hypothetical protein